MTGIFWLAEQTPDYRLLATGYFCPMCDEWMPALQLELSFEQFCQLPRHPGYKYEYLEGRAWLTPRPRHYHALLDLRPTDPAAVPGFAAAGVTLRPMRADDWDELPGLFADTFDTIQPFGGLDEATLDQAARQCLARTRTGGDGPWVERASFVAASERTVVGAILITLLPAGDPCDWESYHWAEPPPADCVERRLGRPHLTWVFVAPLQAGHGVGSALLAAAGNALLDLGYQELLTTFMLGNESSMLWHWRNGFRLLAHPGSFRHRHMRWSRLRKAADPPPNG